MAPHRRHIAILALLCLAPAVSGPARAQAPPHPDLFQVGVYADMSHSLTCFSGAAGDSFEQVVWAWVPDSLGLAYITLRFDFPDNVAFGPRPLFNDLVSNLIITLYNDGSSEWNLIIDDCPSGWVWILTREGVLLDDRPSCIAIQQDHSMMRDCTFILNDLTVLDELALNDPACGSVPDRDLAWGAAKCLYRWPGRPR